MTAVGYVIRPLVELVGVIVAIMSLLVLVVRSVRAAVEGDVVRLGTLDAAEWQVESRAIGFECGLLFSVSGLGFFEDADKVLALEFTS